MNFNKNTNNDMKKYLLISLLTLLTNTFANAQLTIYSSYENEESAVFEVEDMSSNEIKIYNEWVNNGMDPKYALLYINAGRAQDNLINAPATIIDYHLFKDKGNDGAVDVAVEILNTSSKTILEITLEFEFENDYSPVYDIKTGDKYLVLKFANLTGRSTSDIYTEFTENLMKCYYLLRSENATYKKLFYNKKASKVKLHSVSIKYDNGMTSTKAAIFDNGYLGREDLRYDGPLSPIIRCLEFIDKDNAKEVQKEETTQTPQPKDEVFSSAAHMPSYPGGNAALIKYLDDHIQYPEQAKLNNIQGDVVLQFIVTKEGEVGDVKVVRGVDRDLDKEAVRLVKSLPSFSPGRNAVGDPVNVWYTLPVTFKLPSIN